MSDILLKIINMSITATYIVIAVMLFRMIFKKAPKWISCVLWALVGIRLVCPFSFKSVLSLIPSNEPLPPEILTADVPKINSGFATVNNRINPALGKSLAPHMGDSVNPMQIIALCAAVVWLVGIALMLLYMLISFLRVKSSVKAAVKSDGYYICDDIVTPFILGVIRPKIYLPSLLDKADAEYVLAHERAHIKRLDFVWKPLGFLILSVYWFNPVLWAAYMLLCRDIELACDERVIKDKGAEIKKPYLNALVNCSAPRERIAACPLAFGETGVKRRIKNVLSYKKPAFWIIICALLAATVTSVCFATAPVGVKLTSSHLYEKSNTDMYLSDDGASFSYINPDKHLYNKFCDIRISKSEISMDRSGDRDRSHTVVIPDPNANPFVSHLQGIYFCFNADFTEVFEQDDLKPGLTHRVLNPKAAKQIYEELCGFIKKQDNGSDTANEQYTAYNTSDISYNYSTEHDQAALTLYPETNRFTFIMSKFSSYLGSGIYIENGEKLTLITNDGQYRCVFLKEGSSLIFGADKSTEVPKYKYSPEKDAEYCIPNGAVFKNQNPNGNNRLAKPVSFKNAKTYNVGFNDDGYGVIVKNFSLNPYMYQSRNRFYPVASVNSKTELERLLNAIGDYIDLNGKNEDGVSLNSAVKSRYGNEFFKDSSLLLIYITSDKDNHRPDLNGMHEYGENLYIPILRDVSVADRNNMSSWITVTELPKETTAKYTEFIAYDEWQELR